MPEAQPRPAATSQRGVRKVMDGCSHDSVLYVTTYSTGQKSYHRVPLDLADERMDETAQHFLDCIDPVSPVVPPRPRHPMKIER